MTKKWVPLECNPQVFNSLAYSMGVPHSVEFTDVWSLDREMLNFVPRPVYAIILVFPITEKYEENRKSKDSALPLDYYNNISGTDKEHVLWFKQTIGNSCGTMAMIHAVENTLPGMFSKDSVAGKILSHTSSMNVAERSAYLESDVDLEKCHASVAQDGDTEAPPAEEGIDTHYVCFCRSPKDGHLYELDGRRTGPIDHGEIPNDMLCDKAVETIEGFFKEDPSANFSLIAMVAA